MLPTNSEMRRHETDDTHEPIISTFQKAWQILQLALVVRRVGSVAVDNDDDVNFETIGEESSLDLGGPLYVGAVHRHTR